MDLAALVGRFRPLTQKEVRIGMEGSAELAMIAGVHEYGSVKMSIPARSFIGSGKKKAQAAISKLVKKGVTEIALGHRTVKSLLDEIGELGHERMLKNFDRIKQPGLSPIYARLKTGKKLLIADKELRDAIVFKVVQKRRR
jgi:phage gpG-like protein